MVLATFHKLAFASLLLGLLASCRTGPMCSGHLPILLEPYAGNYEKLEAEPDQSQIYGYYSCLAGRDILEGQYRKGLAYEKGYGVDVDLRKARYWYRAAGYATYNNRREVNGMLEPRFRDHVLNGHAEAQYRMGLMYLEGRGEDQDDGFAKIWFNKAAKQGHVKAREKLNVLLKKEMQR